MLQVNHDVPDKLLLAQWTKKCQHLKVQQSSLSAISLEMQILFCNRILSFPQNLTISTGNDFFMELKLSSLTIHLFLIEYLGSVTTSSTAGQISSCFLSTARLVRTDLHPRSLLLFRGCSDFFPASLEKYNLF